MHVATSESVCSVDKLQEYTEFFRRFDHEVTKTSIPVAYQAPVAEWLEEGTPRETVKNGEIQCIIVSKEVLSNTPVRDFSGTVKFVMHPGDILVERVAFQNFDCAKQDIRRILEEHDNVIFELWEEKPECQELVKHFGLQWLCTKILQTDELVGVYGACSLPTSVNYDKYDLLSVARLKLDPADVRECACSLERVPAYIDHYSLCSKEHSWSAVSLRGYGGLTEFISKPSEMSQKWKDENPDKRDWSVSDTPLRPHLPEFEPLIEAIPGRKDRIRLMRLKPGGGEIYRHTDIQDKDAGTAKGKLMRIHIPITTNQQVLFECWDLRGVNQINHMRPGEPWYMDVRKPHRVENKGTTDRIHLVIDVESNEALKQLVDCQDSWRDRGHKNEVLSPQDLFVSD
jgi:hypothetical protein